jgi:hypothetical protein
LLPLEERTLVSKPDLGLDLELASVLDPFRWLDDGLGRLHVWPEPLGFDVL